MQSCPKDIWHSAALKRLEECGRSLFLSDGYDLVESLHHRICWAESQRVHSLGQRHRYHTFTHTTP